MPITLTVPEGLLSPDAEGRVFAGLTDALLEVSQLAGNAFMEPNVVGTINRLPSAHVFAGGKPSAAAFVELKLPSIALATSDAKQAFTERATDVLGHWSKAPRAIRAAGGPAPRAACRGFSGCRAPAQARHGSRGAGQRCDRQSRTVGASCVAGLPRPL